HAPSKLVRKNPALGSHESATARATKKGSSDENPFMIKNYGTAMPFGVLFYCLAFIGSRTISRVI
ncbi:hypothetical protein, partial [Halomonas sp.]|uniref:hypothetical protein n=1 Tax=Halomonas sp. TaxID=1486246 RepID=UPI003A8F9E2F